MSRPPLDFDPKLVDDRSSGVLVVAVVAFLVLIAVVYLVKGVG